MLKIDPKKAAMFDPVMGTVLQSLPPSLPPGDVKVLKGLILAFISNSHTYPQAAEHFVKLVGTTAILDRVNAIINLPEVPIPPSTDDTRDYDSFMLRKKTKPWTEYEDLRLLHGIYRFGLGSWGSISVFVGNSRTRAQCSQRWCRGLDPKISKSQWTKDEDTKLLNLVRIYGKKSWTRISSEMGNRCDVQCRYRYKQLSKDTEEQERIPPIQNILMSMAPQRDLPIPIMIPAIKK